MSVETRLQQLYERQEALIEAMHGLTDVVVQVRDLTTELTEWLQSAPPSELPDLIKKILANVKDQNDRLTAMQGQLKKLPADVARAVTTGGVEC